MQKWKCSHEFVTFIDKDITFLAVHCGQTRLFSLSMIFIIDNNRLVVAALIMSY